MVPIENWLVAGLVYWFNEIVEPAVDVGGKLS